jgi:ubiquitin-protein ligase E3 C
MQAASAQQFEHASVLAGYILTLLRCFPRHGDEIKMRLFLGDIASSVGDVPTIKFLWQAVRQTSIYRQVLSDSDAPLEILRQYLRQTGKSPENSPKEQEWRTILLFLELYIFILRLSDDEDFFGGIYPNLIHNGLPLSRIRSCSLSLQDIKDLSIFLKNLAFVLYYNANQILPPQSSSQSSKIDTFSMQISSPGREEGAQQLKAAPLNGRSIISHAAADLQRLRNIVLTALRMLYERDSRRSFLPAGHWLMTSKFDMEGFINAVVAEEQRQHELAEMSDDEDGMIDSEAGLDFDSEAPRMTMSTRNAQIESRNRENSRKLQRDRLLAAIGPKLEILRHMPFVIPFDTRVQIFRQFVHMDKYRRRNGYVDPDRWRISIINNPFQRSPSQDATLSRHQAKIRRGDVFEDAYKQFYELGEGLKEPIQITFVDQFDTVEAGIDGGGVTKEFLTSVTTEAFGKSDTLTLFSSNKQGLLYPNPKALDEARELLREAWKNEGADEWQSEIQDLLRRYEFLGRIVGKCMYEGILIDVAFAGFFLLKWAATGTGGEYRGNINDLRDMDEELYQGMLQLKNYKGDVADLGLDFTIDDEVSLPGEPVRIMTRKLMPRGEEVMVTNDNRLLYISYVARHRLVAQPAQQTAAFVRGLRSIIHPSWVSMFNQSELQRLVGGDSSEIDIEDLRRNTLYSGVYEIGDDGQEHPTVKLFWKVMADFNDQQRRDVLKYVTSTPRAPLLGFSQLSPQFSIRDGGGDQERLPSTSTCVNLLKLPRYSAEETLRRKLLYAISSGAGFDLS